MTVRVDTRLKDWCKTEINNKAEMLIRRRRRLVPCPWSEDPHKFYMSCLPNEVHAAMDVIENSMGGKFKDIIKRDDKALLKLLVDGKVESLVFKFGGSRVCIPSGYYNEEGFEIKPAHPAFEACAKFVVDWKKAIQEEDAVESLVRHTTETCNTYGQIHRVWPELLPTIGGEKVQAAEKQKRRSSLPCTLDTDRIIRHREEYTFWLAQGALLPNTQPVSYVSQ